MNTSEIAEKIKALVISALKSEQEDRVYLAKNLLLKAYDYTGWRVRWNFMTVQECMENDASRTSCHNAYMDYLNMFLRNEAKYGDVPDISGSDRKTIGDIGNKLVSEMAIYQR